jgi:hypothetical protein
MARCLVMTAGVIVVALAGCSLERAGAGGACTRSTQCAAGLVCVLPKHNASANEGKCSADVSSLNDPTQVPKLMPDAGADAAAAGEDAGS